MARKRMISKDVTDTDKFTSVSLAARGLYMHLNLEADDDGFITSAIRTTKSVGGTDEMLNELVDSGYLIRFESGIFLVRDWNVHNTVQKDRYTPTRCTKELAQVKKKDGIYYTAMDPEWIQIGSNVDPQISIDKDSKDKNKNKGKPKTNSFNNIEQNTYNFEELEKQLLTTPVG